MNCDNTARIPNQVQSDIDTVVDDDHADNNECVPDFSIPLKVNDTKIQRDLQLVLAYNVLQNVTYSPPQALFQWAKSNCKKNETFFSSKESYAIATEILKGRFDQAVTIPGTLQYHAFISTFHLLKSMTFSQKAKKKPQKRPTKLPPKAKKIARKPNSTK